MNGAVDELAKLLVPGTGSCFAISLAAGAVLLPAPRRWRAAGGAIIAATLLGYAALAMPPVSYGLERGLACGFRSIQTPAESHGAAAVVIIGNGVSTHLHNGRYVHEMKRETRENVAEGVRLARLLGDPVLIVSGGIADPESQARTEADMMREALVGAGVPAGRILMDAVSRNTYEQAREVAAILARARIDNFIVVTAPTHMRRVHRLFTHLGLTPVTSVPLGRGHAATLRPWPFSRAALAASREAAYEYMALLGYWARGRI
jgi:uncharacterized SAM-binding protein YcdF (DUF218 family)